MATKEQDATKLLNEASSPDVVVVSSVLISLVAIAFHFVQGEESPFLLSAIPRECLVYPPPSDCVNGFLPWLIGALGMLMAVNVISTLSEKPSKDAQDNIDRQSERRHEIVKEMVEELDGREDLTDGKIHGIRYSMLFDRTRDLVAIPDFDPDLMNRSFRWVFALYRKELEISITKTREGEDILYASGKRLGSILGEAHKCCDKAVEANASLKGEEKAEFWKLVREGRKLYYTLGFKTVTKAFKMILKAKSVLLWVLLQTLGTALTAVVDASAWHYRVQVLESMFQRGDAFWNAAQAMFLIGILRKLMGVLTEMMRIRGAKRVGCDIQVLLFDALIKMEVSWWAIQSIENAHKAWGDKVDIGTVLWANEEVEEFLEIPQDMIESIASAMSHAVIIARTSSKALWLQLGVNVGLTGFQWMLKLAFKRMETMAKRGLIAPCEDDYTFYYSLRPEYVSTYQSFVRGATEVNSFRSYVQHDINESRREALVECLEDPIMASLSMGGEVAQMMLASDLVSGGHMGVAQASGVISASGTISKEFRGVFRMFSKAVQKAYPLAQAYDLCTLPKTIDPDVGLRPAGRCKGHIQFEDVRFQYPRRDVEVLKGVSFEISPGETLGMTGTAGCGKSSALRLLERFYDVTGGSIKLDGRDIREYNPLWLRSQIATVAQEPMLLPGMSIRENITFGCSYEPTLEQIHDACKAANIYDSLMNKDKFPSGLRTELGAVQNVSGGEKQRIAIARAIMADPPILLLDEATSALDEENQRKVQEALNKLMEGRTTLMIAHRLSTIKDSDKIVSFKGGKVVECGTHDELVSNDDSIYGALWKKQCSHPELVDAVESSDDETEFEFNDNVESMMEGSVRRRQSLVVEGANNPPPSTETRLAALEQRVTTLSIDDHHSGFAKEAKKILELLKLEADVLKGEKENDKAYYRSEDPRDLGLQALGVNKWRAQMKKDDSDPKLKSVANRVLFLNRHAKIKQQLAEMDELPPAVRTQRKRASIH